MEKNERIVEAEEKMPEGPSKLGYFVSKDQTRKNADNVCVLVVHYSFKKAKNTKKVRRGDDEDVKNLERTFRVNRNCNFRSILSPEKGQLLKLLSNQEEILRLFTCSDVPSVFVLYILSHGSRNGKILTDYHQNDDPNDFISFTTAEIFDSLKKLTGFEECLKFVNFGACRGQLEDAAFVPSQKCVSFKNENSCQITYSPLMRNTVVFFSTVETTMSKRHPQLGSTFVRLTCQVLNSLKMDQSLVNVLTTVQYESHKIVVDGKNGQTPEFKMFSQDRYFFFSESPTNKPDTSTSDAQFYDWEKLRRRLAFLFSAKPNEQLKEIKRALSKNLGFETSEWRLSGNPWSHINKIPRFDCDNGCLFLFLFAQVSENKDTNEVCVQVDSGETAVSEILRQFIGPKNDKWIGKPKILFVLDQETTLDDDSAVSEKPKRDDTATNHSGWLVLVLHSKEKIEKLIEIFKGQELKQEKSLQELLASLLISNSIESRDMIDSTLQYLLNFPDLYGSFVKLNFSVEDSQECKTRPQPHSTNFNKSFYLNKIKLTTAPIFVQNSQEFQEKIICFDSLVKEAARKKRIWLLSSVAGSGKTTILREMAFQLGKLDPELKILRISLPSVSFSTLKRNVTEIEFLAKATPNSQEEIIKSIENKQCVVFLDGFDEIRPEKQEKILKVIEALEKKQISVWIGTRPHAEKTILERTSNAVLVKIDRLNQEQQIELLQQETDMSKGDCEEFIKNFTSKDILSNPLHLSLVAKYGAEGNLYQIYDQVVRHKVEDSLIRNGYDKNNKVKFQEEIDVAFECLRQIASFHMRVFPPIGYTRQDLEKINCYGIASYENNKVIFIHQTFAEFLAAQHFLREIEDSGKCDYQTSTQILAQLFLEEWQVGFRHFVDLFYSTVLTDEEMIEEHRASILPIVKECPPVFLELIVRNGYVNIFKIIHPIITFSKNQEGSCIYVINNWSLLEKAILGHAEEIAIKLLDKDYMNSYVDLLIILPSLLTSVAGSNATRFYEKLKTKFPRLPEMIRYRRCIIDAGVIAARKNHGEILELLLKSGVDIDYVEKYYGNTLYYATRHGAMKCVETLLKHGAKLARNKWGNSLDPLMLAVQENNLDLVKLLLDENISGLQRNKETFENNEVNIYLKALQYSIHRGHKEIAKFLMEKSSSLKHEENGYDGSLLQFAAGRGCLEMCQWLVDEAGVDVNTLRPSGEPTHWSLDDFICMDHFLILQKSDIDMTDERGKTALHCAAEHGYLERVQELIDSGANIRAQDENGWNAFHFACKSNSDHKEKVIRLLHSTDCQLAKETTKSGQTGLHILLNSCNDPLDEKARFLVEEIGVDVRAKDNNGCTSLRLAVNEGKDCVDYLMTKDINLDFKNKWGQTCLHAAAERSDLEALQTWIELGGDLDVVDEDGWTALHCAAEGGHLPFVEKLIACVAKEDKNPDIGMGSIGSALKERVNRCDNRGRTPLHLAAESENIDLVKMLLKNGADLSQTDKEGKNAIHYAIKNKRMLRFINAKNGSLVKQPLNGGGTTLHLALWTGRGYESIALWIIEKVDDAVLNAKNASGDTPLLLACKYMTWSVAKKLLTRNVEVNVQDARGKTAMHYAAEKGKLNLVELMHEKGADFALTDNDGMNTLHHAMRYSQTFLFILEKNNELLRLKNGDTTFHLASHSLLNVPISKQNPIDLNSTNSEGHETLLQLACKKGEWIIAKILLDKSVDIHMKDKKGRTALHYAVNLKENPPVLENIIRTIPSDYSIVHELCQRGADLTLTDNDGMNAFHHAIKNFDIARLLDGLNGDLVKQRLNNGDTALHLAIKLEEYDRNISVITVWLVEKGVVDLNARNALNETPLILACKMGPWTWDIVEILLSKNVDVNVRDNEGKSARDYVEQYCPTQLILIKRFDDIEASSIAK